MKSNVVVKINKIGKVGQVITKIGKVILVIAFAACLFGAAVLTFVPKDMVTMEMSHQSVVQVDFSALPSSIFLGNMWNMENLDPAFYEYEDNILQFRSDSETYVIKLSDMIHVVISVIIYLVTLYIVFHFVGKLCACFSCCETPFTNEVVRGLKRLAISILPMAFCSTITQSVTKYVNNGNVTVSFSIDLVMVLLVVLIFMLASIFKYGTMLQLESDETL